MASGKMLAVGFVACAAAVFATNTAFANDIAKYDKNMAVEGIVVTNGIKWIDGKLLPIEGRAFNDIEHYYARLPAGVTTNVNGGVRAMKHPEFTQTQVHRVRGAIQPSHPLSSPSPPGRLQFMGSRRVGHN